MSAPPPYTGQVTAGEIAFIIFATPVIIFGVSVLAVCYAHLLVWLWGVLA